MQAFEKIYCVDFLLISLVNLYFSFEMTKLIHLGKVNKFYLLMELYISNMLERGEILRINIMCYHLNESLSFLKV